MIQDVLYHILEYRLPDNAEINYIDLFDDGFGHDVLAGDILFNSAYSCTFRYNVHLLDIDDSMEVSEFCERVWTEIKEWSVNCNVNISDKET